uniref:Uncharacterized protein n=1 Tax=Caenorhabditis japonica TaxID=281687 RepID=A0A8R1IAX9_CAEJA
MDGILLTTIQIHVDDQQLKKGICDKTKLELEDIAYSPICTSTDQFIYMTYNGTTPITGKENITILLTTDTTDGTANFTGVFSTAKSPANELAIDLVTLQREVYES